ncbi:hypothetical protein COOONC_09809, partial [Cooperia oncophora]
MLVGDDVLPILTATPDPMPGVSPPPIPVCAQTTVVVPPASEFPVLCYIKEKDPQYATIMTDGATSSCPPPFARRRAPPSSYDSPDPSPSSSQPRALAQLSDTLASTSGNVACSPAADSTSPRAALARMALELGSAPDSSTPGRGLAPATTSEGSRADAFSRYRTPASSEPGPSTSTPTARVAPYPAKRFCSAVTASPLRGIQPHPARSPRWVQTPDDYVNEFSHLHPWGGLVEPRPPIPNLTEDMLTAQMPAHVYRFIPQDGYFASRFVRSLFPRRFVGTPSPTNKISIMEITRLPDIIAFRQHAMALADELLDYTYVSDYEE